MTIKAHHRRLAFRGVTVLSCLVGLWASAATDAEAQARRQRPLFGSAPSATATTTRERGRVDRPRAKRERRVTLAASALDPRTARDGASDLDLQFFTDRRLAVRLDRIDRRSANSFTWHGRVIGAGGGPATFVSTNGVVAGTVFTRDAVFEVGYAGGGAHEVRELDPLAFPTDDPPDQLPVIDTADETTPVPPLDTAAQIDVLVLWTAAARTAAGGSSAIQSTIDLAIANANTAYANSGITTRLRLVNKAEIGYTEASISTDLGRLQGTNDGYLDAAHTLRDQYGADLVSLIGNGYTSAGACGIGYLMTSPSTTFATNAFNVVDWSCAASNLSLAHELGHNQGMHHDVANASGGQGAYPYSFGYQDPAGNFRTVMAYACGYGAGCPRRPYFSTPLYTYNSVPLGTASADNARTLNDTASYVANFRQAVMGACTYSLSPASVNASSSATTQNVSVTAGTGCAWSAQSNSPTWLTVTAGSSGSGNGTMTLSIAANATTSQRTGMVTVSGQTVTVTQAGTVNCTYALGATSWSAPAAGGPSSVSVTVTGSGCSYSVVSNQPWLTVTSGSGGTGSGTVQFTVAANTSTTSRTGTLTIAGQAFTVTQAGAISCTYTVTPTSYSAPHAAGSSTVTVTPSNSACTWTASTASTWLSLSPAAGTGTGTVWFSFQPNPSRTARSATFNLQGRTVTVNQAAGPRVVAAGTRFTFDTDIRNDFVVWRPSTGEWLSSMSGGASSTLTWGEAGDTPVPADFDGDGIVDVAVWRPSTGTWYVAFSSGGWVRLPNWGIAGDIPVPADYDGDGRADYAVWRPSNGSWYVAYSGGGWRVTPNWGLAIDVPVPADYDGDRKADLAVWRASSGSWLIVFSTGGWTYTSGWGIPGDVPVPADYDGDGRYDMAVWRPSGAFLILKSAGGWQAVSSTGTVGDIPVVGDYDGDAKADPAIWRPSTGEWFARLSYNGSTLSRNCGAPMDRPQFRH